jgi:WD40 repeat protein
MILKKLSKINIQYLIMYFLITLIISSCGDGENIDNFASNFRNGEIYEQTEKSFLASLPQSTKEYSPTDSQLFVYSQNFDEINNIYLSQDFQLIVGASSNDIVVYDTLGAKSTRNIFSKNPGKLAISPKNEFISWVSENNNISIADVDKQKKPTLSINNKTPVTSLTFSPGSEHLAYATYSNDLKIYNIYDEAVEKSWIIPEWLSNLAYSPDGAFIAGVSLPSNTIYFIDVITGNIKNELNWDNPVTSKLYGAYLSPDWHSIAWISGNVIQIMEVETSKLGAILIHKDPVSNFTWAQDSTLVISSSLDEINGDLVPVVYIWDVFNGNVINTFVSNSPIKNISFSVDKDEIAVYSSSGELTIWSINNTNSGIQK